MQSPGKFSAIVFLAILALACAISAAYFLSILRWGHWQYPGVAGALIASALTAVFALVGVAAITTRGQGNHSTLRRASLLVLTYATASGASFLLLANCSLSCGNRVLTVTRSPNGNWKAGRYLRQCVYPT